MTSIDCQIDGAQGQISANALRTAVQQTVGLLDEYDAALSGATSPTLRWNVWDMSSANGLLIRFRSDLVARKKRHHPVVVDMSADIAKELIDGIGTISRDLLPQYLSEFGLNRIAAMARVVEKKEAQSFTLRTNGHVASVTEATSAHLLKISDIRRTSIGSVEGRLVNVNVAKNPRITIIHHLSKKSVSCSVDQAQLDLIVKNALGKRVVVHGVLHKNENGDTIRVSMREIAELTTEYRREQMLASTRFPVPDFAVSKNTDEYLSHTRGC